MSRAGACPQVLISTRHSTASVWPSSCHDVSEMTQCADNDGINAPIITRCACTCICNRDGRNVLTSMVSRSVLAHGHLHLFRHERGHRERVMPSRSGRMPSRTRPRYLRQMSGLTAGRTGAPSVSEDDEQYVGFPQAAWRPGPARRASRAEAPYSLAHTRLCPARRWRTSATAAAGPVNPASSLFAHPFGRGQYRRGVFGCCGENGGL
jgi:hypothetical protein